MLLLIITGPIRAWFHIQADLIAGGTIVIERFLRGAPFLAPMALYQYGTTWLVGPGGN